MKQSKPLRRHIPKQDILLTVNDGDPLLLLEFMLKRMSEKPSGTVKSYLSHGQVSVNGTATTKFNFPLKSGQEVRIAAEKVSNLSKPKLFTVIYEDENLIVINKTAGLLTVGTDKESERTAFHLVGEYIRRTKPKARIFVVHRLDRDTSGVVMFAKSERVKLAFQDNWDDIVKKRGYIALVEGAPPKDNGRIVSYLKETSTHLVYSSYSEDDGKRAVTNYSVRDKGENYSLLDITIETGRKNQIRVHMKDIGCPVAGDKKYGASGNPIGRLGLHASVLELTNPLTGELMSFEAPVSGKFITAVQQ